MIWRKVSIIRYGKKGFFDMIWCLIFILFVIFDPLMDTWWKVTFLHLTLDMFLRKLSFILVNFRTQAYRLKVRFLLTISLLTMKGLGFYRLFSIKVLKFLSVVLCLTKNIGQILQCTLYIETLMLWLYHFVNHENSSLIIL